MDKVLIEKVLQLSPGDRMRLLNTIYSSLERPDAQIDEIWYDEAQKRLDSHKAGKVKAIGAKSVIGKRP